MIDNCVENETETSFCYCINPQYVLVLKVVLSSWQISFKNSILELEKVRERQQILSEMCNMFQIRQDYKEGGIMA